MGARGPKPTPTALGILKGSARAKARKKVEPQPEIVALDCPAWLKGEARECWKKLIPQLVELGVLGRIDGNALARYCHTWARWRKLETYIARRGETSTIVTEKGGAYEQQRPQVGIANKLSVTLGKLEAEFGMTPSARSRINMTPTKAKGSQVGKRDRSA